MLTFRWFMQSYTTQRVMFYVSMHAAPPAPTQNPNINVAMERKKRLAYLNLEDIISVVCCVSFSAAY